MCLIDANTTKTVRPHIKYINDSNFPKSYFLLSDTNANDSAVNWFAGFDFDKSHTWYQSPPSSGKSVVCICKLVKSHHKHLLPVPEIFALGLQHFFVVVHHGIQFISVCETQLTPIVFVASELIQGLTHSRDKGWKPESKKTHTFESDYSHRLWYLYKKRVLQIFPETTGVEHNLPS